MLGHVAEDVFREYLDSHPYIYQRDYIVGDEANPKNVDFFIEFEKSLICADVKAVVTSRQEGELDAQRNIRKDIRSLREKFGRNRPVTPVVLVTMNFSEKFFTGLTVARALLGEIGCFFDFYGRAPIQHMPRGNAVLTQHQNQIISAVLAFDRVNGNHVLFENPFADHRVPPSFFHDVRAISLDRNAGEPELAGLSRIMYWPPSPVTVK